MRNNILLTTHNLKNYGGSELNILDLAIELSNENADVFVATFLYDYPIKKLFDDKKIKVVNILTDNLPIRQFDLIWAQHAPVLYHILFEQNIIADKIIFSSLSPYEPLEVSPAFVNDLTFCLANSYETRDQLIIEGVSPEQIFVFPNSVSEDFFQQSFVNQSKLLKRICIVSNHIPEELIETKTILGDLGISCDIYGQRHNYKLVTPSLLQPYDAILTIGKTVQYGLALGKPVYCYDQFGGPGWITLKNIETAQYYNFSGRCCNRKLPALLLTEDIVNGFQTCLFQQSQLNEYAVKNFSLRKNIKHLFNLVNNKTNILHVDIIKNNFRCKRANQYYVRWLKSVQKQFQLESAEICYAVVDSLVNMFVQQNKTAAIWGAGITAVGLFDNCHSFKKLVKIVIDKAPQLHGSKFLDFTIQNPDCLKESNIDIIIIASIKYAKEIREYIKENYPDKIILDINGISKT